MYKLPNFFYEKSELTNNDNYEIFRFSIRSRSSIIKCIYFSQFLSAYNYFWKKKEMIIDFKSLILDKRLIFGKRSSFRLAALIYGIQFAKKYC